MIREGWASFVETQAITFIIYVLAIETLSYTTSPFSNEFPIGFSNHLKKYGDIFWTL